MKGSRAPTKFRFIDLFAGIGGFRVALEKRGHQCVFSSEIDRHAREAYVANFGEEPGGDITQIKSEDIPEHDVLCAGFPCQAFSLSGKMLGMGDERGRLFFEIVRIARHHRPKVLLLENVKNIVSLDKGRVLGEIRRNLDKAGYALNHYVLNASQFSIPQKRERVYFIGLRKDLSWTSELPKPDGKMLYLKDIIIKGADTAELVIDREYQMTVEKEIKPTPKPVRIGFLNKGGQGERIYSINGHAITLAANSGGVGHRTGLYYVDGEVRRLHIDEAKQVMGFSEDHKVSEGLQGYKQLGNAVIPLMVGTVFDNIRWA